MLASLRAPVMRAARATTGLSRAFSADTHEFTFGTPAVTHNLEDGGPAQSTTATKEELDHYLETMLRMRRMEIAFDNEYKVRLRGGWWRKGRGWLLRYGGAAMAEAAADRRLMTAERAAVAAASAAAAAAAASATAATISVPIAIFIAAAAFLLHVDVPPTCFIAPLATTQLINKITPRPCSGAQHPRLLPPVRRPRGSGTRTGERADP